MRRPRPWPRQTADIGDLAEGSADYEFSDDNQGCHLPATFIRVSCLGCSERGRRAHVAATHIRH